MNNAVSNGRRMLLKTGLILLPGAGWYATSLAEPVSTQSLLSVASRHRWLGPDAAAAATLRFVPPLLQQEHSAAPIFWLDTNLQLVRKYRLNPLRAARSFSYLMAAMHDVVLSCVARYGSSTAHCAAGIHLTAGRVLEYLFPQEMKGRWSGQGIVAASVHATAIRTDEPALTLLAEAIAQRAIHRAMVDGSVRIDALLQPPKNTALPWKATPPLWSSRPVEPGAPSWRPWLVPATIGEQCAPPLSLDNTRYANEVRHVHQVQQTLTPEQKKMADDWNLDLGTVTPPGVWLMKVAGNETFLQLELVQQTAVLSVLAATMLDAFTACWFVKFKWWTERPVTAIRRTYDASFTPYLITPSFPSYTSGHAAISGAAAGVLARLLPRHRKEWTDAAQAAADSRLYGGIHFTFDNEEGLVLGQKVAERAIAELRRADNAA